jgi:predicted transcriptional regulator
MMPTVTVKQLAERIESLEQSVARLAEQLDYQQAVEGIRRGLESVERGEGIPAKQMIAHLNRLRKSPGAK